MKGNIAVIDILRDDATFGALVGGTGTDAKVFPIAAPQQTKFPYCLVEKDSEEPFDSKSGISSTQHDSITVFHYGTSYTEALSMATAARSALDGVSGTYNGVIVEYLRFIDDSDFIDKVENSLMYVIEQQYEVRTKQVFDT